MPLLPTASLMLLSTFYCILIIIIIIIIKKTRKSAQPSPVTADGGQTNKQINKQTRRMAIPPGTGNNGRKMVRPTYDRPNLTTNTIRGGHSSFSVNNRSSFTVNLLLSLFSANSLDKGMRAVQ